MAQTRWETRFKPARYGPVVNPADSPARTLLDPGDIGPADLVGHEVLHYLANDEILRGVFEDRFEFMPWRNLFNFQKFPRVGVYLSSTINAEKPTSMSIETVSIYVATLWDAQSAEPVEDGLPTVSTVLSHIKRVLRTDKALTLVVHYGDGQKSLSSTSVKPEGESFAPIPLNQRLGFINELQFTYTLRLDRSKARLEWMA